MNQTPEQKSREVIDNMLEQAGWADESLEDSDNLPAPDVLSMEIVEDLEAALMQFKEITDDLGGA